DLPGALHARDPGCDAVDVDRGGLVALEAEHDRPVRAVAPAGEPEATEQLDLHARGGRELAVRVEAPGGPARRPHRADRVRARRTDADLEDVEHRDMHGTKVYSGLPRCAPGAPGPLG